MADFDRLKKNIYIINIHLHKKDEAKANMIQNFIQNNHGVSTVNHVTHGHINAGKNDVLDPEPFIDSYTEPATEPFTKAIIEERPECSSMFLKQFLKVYNIIVQKYCQQNGKICKLSCN